MSTSFFHVLDSKEKRKGKSIVDVEFARHQFSYFEFTLPESQIFRTLKTDTHTHTHTHTNTSENGNVLIEISSCQSFN